jgi:secretion/DNA translocation related TadE-like protein
MGCGGSDRGSASFWLLAVGLLLVAAGSAQAAVATVYVAQQRARAAADLGALAGASLTLRDPTGACRRASELVAANGARPAGCRLDGLDLWITAEVVVTPMPGMTRVVAATSGAGPLRG